MRKNQFYEQELMNLPDGVRKAVADILLDHQGVGLAIGRGRLVMEAQRRLKRGELSSKQITNLDRTVRKAIEELRAAGWLIGSNLDGDGYYLIKDMAEFEAFKAEYTSRAYQVIETSKVLESAACRLFGDPKRAGQLPLITE